MGRQEAVGVPAQPPAVPVREAAAAAALAAAAVAAAPVRVGADQWPLWLAAVLPGRAEVIPLEERGCHRALSHPAPSNREGILPTQPEIMCL